MDSDRLGLNSIPGPYPVAPEDRNRWILAQRGPRQAAVRADRPHGYLIESERTATGEIAPTATLFLTNRECPWRCLMCDLWKTTLPTPVPLGAIPAQIDFAFAELRLTVKAGRTIARADHQAHPVRQVKLYNGGSFFDAAAIPSADHRDIVQRISAFERVIVECHPSLVRESCVRFRDMLEQASNRLEAGKAPAQLEIAMGLETVHPDVLEKLNKRMTLEVFSNAAQFLNRHQIPWRAFVLVKPPFMDEDAGLNWAERSVDFALDAGATAVSLIPTRPGNGALELLQKQGQFSAPKLTTLEAAQAYGISLQRQRVFADLWDTERFSECATCYKKRFERLQRMNLEQVLLPDVPCPACSCPQ
jgi:radical SAM enzyme (TIGR01210 family)